MLSIMKEFLLKKKMVFNNIYRISHDLISHHTFIGGNRSPRIRLPVKIAIISILLAIHLGSNQFFVSHDDIIHWDGVIRASNIFQCILFGFRKLELFFLILIFPFLVFLFVLVTLLPYHRIHFLSISTNLLSLFM